MRYYGSKIVKQRVELDLPDHIDAILYSEQHPRHRLINELLLYKHYTDIEAQREELASEDAGRIEMAIRYLVEADELLTKMLKIAGV